MQKNIGTADRVVRFIIGIILLVIALVAPVSGVVKVILIIGAIFSFYQAMTSWCLLYQLIGKNTCPVPPVAQPATPTPVPTPSSVSVETLATSVAMDPTSEPPVPPVTQ